MLPDGFSNIFFRTLLVINNLFHLLKKSFPGCFVRVCASVLGMVSPAEIWKIVNIVIAKFRCGKF